VPSAVWDPDELPDAVQSSGYSAMKADSQRPYRDCNPHHTFEENRRAFEKVRTELNKLRRQMCESEENMAALDNIIEEVRERRKGELP